MTADAADVRLAFRWARNDDIDPVVALIESAYRGEASRAGWTTEADLLDGRRTDADAVADIVADPRSDLLLAFGGASLLACAQLERRGEAAYFGMFSVRPALQGGGIGGKVLAEAERVARVEWGCRRMEMKVIEQRVELIAWYERRGYRRTGAFAPFPYGDERFGVPRRPDLRFVVLDKPL